MNNKIKGAPIDLEGIRGWLLFVFFGMIFSFLMVIVDLVDSFNLIKNLNQYIKEFHIVIFIYFFSDIILFLLTLFNIIFMLMHKRIAIYTIIFSYCFNILYKLILYILCNNISQLNKSFTDNILSGLIYGVITSILWGTYILKSKRVKKTFIK